MKTMWKNEELKFALLGVMWAVGASILASILSFITLYKFNDILFIEGLILLGIGVLSSINEEELCGSLKGTGGFSCQYISSELQVAKKEDKIIKLNADLINMDMIIGGIISILILLI